MYDIFISKRKNIYISSLKDTKFSNIRNSDLNKIFVYVSLDV